MTPDDSHRGPEAASWLRNAHAAVYAFMSVCAASGLCYVFYSAFVGHVVGAVVGALVAVGGAAVGFLALAAVRLGAILIERTARIEQLTLRVKRLESLVARQEEFEFVGGSADQTHNLVAADARCEAFPRLVRGNAVGGATESVPRTRIDGHVLAACEHAWQSAYEAGDIPGCHAALKDLRAEVDPARLATMTEGLRAMTRATAARLRNRFAAAVRCENYAAALLTGDQIAGLFPDTPMARDFARLRPHVIRRAEQQPCSPR